MKKGANLFFSIFVLVSLFISCSKSGSSTTASNLKYRMDATINGTKYTWENIGTFSFDNNPGCIASKSYILTNAGQITSAQYKLDVLVKTYRVASDFVSSTGAHSIQPAYKLESSSTCNFDISVDLTQNNTDCILQNTSKVNNITSVSKASETSSYILYKVSGNFSCNFKNSSNVIIPVSGTYTTYVQAFK
jgi:hypothetical protein